MATTFSVSLFGKLAFQRDAQPLPPLETRKAQELFCYLLLYRDRAHPRETLASVLWGDIATAQSKTYLRKALWQLQTLLDALGPASGPALLLVTPEWIQLNPQAPLRLDVAVFEQAFRAVQGIPGERLAPQASQDLHQAITLYQADLLEGWYLDWCLYERERLQQMYIIMLDKLMAYCEAQRAYEVGLGYGSRILRYDRAHEGTHRRLMRLHYLAGDRTAALRQYERCRAALQAELDIQPTPATRLLYEQIKNQSPAEAVTGPALSSVPGAPPALPDLLQHLKQLQTSLTALQSTVQENIQAVEQALDGPQ